MADYVFGAQTPNGQDFDASWHTVGIRTAVSSNATLTGGRVWYPTTDPANFVWIVYRESDQAIIASVDLAAHFGTGATNSAWNTFTSADFDTPGDVALSASEKYYVCVATNGDYVFNNAASYPIGAGIITADRSQFFNGGTGPTFPTSNNTSDWFFADALVQAASSAPVLPLRPRVRRPRNLPIVRRGETATTVGAPQFAPIPPPGRSGVPGVVGALLARSTRGATPVPEQAGPPLPPSGNSQPRGPRGLSRRTANTRTPPAGTAPAPAGRTTGHRPALCPPTRRATPAVVPAPVVPPIVSPVPLPGSNRHRRMLWSRRRTTLLPPLPVACSCTVLRPFTGTVTRPGSGTVLRPFTGTVARPCACH